MPRRLYLAAPVFATAVALLAGCSTGSGTSSQGQSTTSSTSSSSSSEVSGSGSSSTSPTDAEHGPLPEAGSTVGPETFQQAIEAGAVLIDVRTPAEYAAGHIDGATNLDVNSAEGQAALAKLDPQQDYALYCHSGNRSRAAMQVMANAGVMKTFDLDGGITLWQSAGYEVVTG